MKKNITLLFLFVLLSYQPKSLGNTPYNSKIDSITFTTHNNIEIDNPHTLLEQSTNANPEKDIDLSSFNENINEKDIANQQLSNYDDKVKYAKKYIYVSIIASTVASTVISIGIMWLLTTTKN